MDTSTHVVFRKVYNILNVHLNLQVVLSLQEIFWSDVTLTFGSDIKTIKRRAILESLLIEIHMYSI